MKALIIANRERYEHYYPGGPFADSLEKIYVEMDEAVESILEKAGDADFLAADAIAPVTKELIDGMPNLKVIHSEGVAFNLIDCEAAAGRGVYVCNNAGVNAKAVAEQTILLMLMVKRQAIRSHNAAMEGHQIEEKLRMMGSIDELGKCSVGLIGFGNIAKATAKLLNAFGSQVFYYTPERKSAELEQEYNAAYMDLPEMRRTCDIISIHVPVTPETTGMIDAEFFDSMKNTAVLINTARGEIVDNEALADALIKGKIAGAGLDTIAPEPVPADHILLHLPKDAQDKLTISSHIGGGTRNAFMNSHRNIWKAFEDAAAGRRPKNIVNGL